MSALSTAERLRWLADVIDAVGDQAIDVHDAEPLGVDDGGDRLVAEVVLSAPRPDVLERAGANEITETDLESIAFVEEDHEADWETVEDLEEEAPKVDETADQEPIPPELADEPIGPEPAPEDPDPDEPDEDDVQEEADEEFECDADGCDFVSDSPQGLGAHKRHRHSDTETEKRTLNDRIVEALEKADGELPTSEIKERTDSGASVYNALSRLQREDEIESRKDPKNRNRKLYRIAGTAIGEGDTDDVDDQDSEDSDEQDGDDEDPFTAAANRRRQQTDSTESDTTESASEADDPTTALEEDGDDQEAPEGRHCKRCNLTFASGLEHDIHRTEVHDASLSSLNYLERGEFAEIVEEADAVSDIVDATGYSTKRTLQILGIYGLADVVGPDGIELSDINDFEFDTQPTFDDFETPGWLDEASFYTACEAATTIDELTEILGWTDREQLRSMVTQLDADVDGEEVVA